MTFTTTQHGSVSVIGVEGNLMGGPDASALNGKLHELVEAGITKVVLDLRGVQFMNSSGLGLMIGGASTLKSAGGGLKLANASEKIMALIKITKLESLFDNYSSVEEAVAGFRT